MNSVMCQSCGERPGTEIWAEGTVAYVHGCYQMWCKICVLRAQIDHAKKQTSIPELEKQLVEELAAKIP